MGRRLLTLTEPFNELRHHIAGHKPVEPCPGNLDSQGIDFAANPPFRLVKKISQLANR
jgi:hypothetical protein